MNMEGSEHMLKLPVHTADTAPDSSTEAIAQAARAFGFVPNLIGVLASAPAAADSYLALTRIFGETSLSEIERQTVLLTVSHAHECGYCMAAHTAAATMAGTTPEVLRALRAGEPLPDARLEALRRMTHALVATRGRPETADIHAFLDAGYSEVQLLEVVVGIALKTISNYTNHLADTPLDVPLQKFAWTPPDRESERAAGQELCEVCAGR
jgi:uncharacterized peroxidase-related enzyme